MTKEEILSGEKFCYRESRLRYAVLKDEDEGLKLMFFDGPFGVTAMPIGEITDSHFSAMGVEIKFENCHLFSGGTP